MCKKEFGRGGNGYMLKNEAISLLQWSQGCCPVCANCTTFYMNNSAAHFLYFLRLYAPIMNKSVNFFGVLQSLGQSKQYIYHGGEVTVVRPQPC
jgi:hypothetical protein